MNILNSTKDNIEIRLVRNMAEMNVVYSLIHDSYLKKGYCSVQPNRKLIHYPHLNNIPETKILIALQHNKIIGTISLTVDGLKGLPVDVDFRYEVDKFRLKGLKLASMWRLATFSTENNQIIVIKIIAKAAEIMVKTMATHCIFSFAKRHEKVYKRLLNINVISRKNEIELNNKLVKVSAILAINTREDFLHFLKFYQQRNPHS